MGAKPQGRATAPPWPPVGAFMGLLLAIGCGSMGEPEPVDPLSELRVALGEISLTDAIAAQLPDDAEAAVVVHLDHVAVVRVGEDATQPGELEEVTVWRLALNDGVPDEADCRGVLIQPLYDVLQQRADDCKTRSAADPERPFTGVAILAAEREVPFGTVRAVMYSAAQAQFHPFHFWSG